MKRPLHKRTLNDVITENVHNGINVISPIKCQTCCCYFVFVLSHQHWSEFLNTESVLYIAVLSNLTKTKTVSISVKNCTEFRGKDCFLNFFLTYKYNLVSVLVFSCIVSIHFPIRRGSNARIWQMKMQIRVACLVNCKTGNSRWMLLDQAALLVEN